MRGRNAPAALLDIVAYVLAAIELLAVITWIWDIGASPSSRLLYAFFTRSYYDLGLALVILGGVGAVVLYVSRGSWRRSTICLAVTSVLLLGQLASMAFLQLTLGGSWGP